MTAEQENLKERLSAVIGRYVRTLQDSSRIPEPMLEGLAQLIQQEADRRMFQMDLMPKEEAFGLINELRLKIHELEAQPTEPVVFNLDCSKMTDTEVEEWKQRWLDETRDKKWEIIEPVRPQGKAQRTKPVAG